MSNHPAFFKGKLFEYSSDSGLYVLIYAAKLACSPEKVLTNSGIDILIHDMIQTNQDQSLLKQMQNEITSLMLALSEKYSLVHSKDTIVVYPSLFDSIKDDSSNSGYSSKQLTSTSNDTSDSDWTLSHKRKADAISGESVSDMDMNLDDARHQSRSNLNYITDTFSQDSNNQESSSKASVEMDSPDDSVDEDDESGVLHFKGQF
jgi:hypothetical protein